MKLNRKNRHLLLLSGGADSTYLFYWLKKKQYQFTVFHVNYQKRNEANNDEAFVKALCQKYNIVCEILKFNVEETSSKNFQSQARQYRYQKAICYSKKNNIHKIITGHNKDDILETIIFNKERKTSPRYLGIKNKIYFNDIQIIRPIAKYWKFQIIKRLNKMNIDYCIDKTNDEPIYQRNIIRKKIAKMPWLIKQKILLFAKINNLLNFWSIFQIKKAISFCIVNNKLVIKNYIKINKKYRFDVLAFWLNHNECKINKNKLMQIKDFIFSNSKKKIFILNANLIMIFKIDSYIIRSATINKKKRQNIF